MHIFIVGTEMVKINTNIKKFTTTEDWSMPIWYNIFLIAKRYSRWVRRTTILYLPI